MTLIMNFLKKYVWLAAGLGVSFALLVAVGGRLFFVFKNYQKESSELESARTRLEQLHQRPVFPSRENIATENARLSDLTDEHNELLSWLSADQVMPAEMEAAAFMPFLENTLRRIRAGLQKGKVNFPDKYTFDFEKYAGGQLPASQNIPRLVQQLVMTEKICQILPDAAVSELAEFKRDEFESADEKKAAAGGRRQPAPPPKSAAAKPAGGKELYSSQHFKMTFRASEAAAIDFLNRLARLPMFTVVTWVEISNQRQETAIAASKEQAAAADKAREGDVSRDRRLMLGREEIEVKVEFDVFNFEPPVDFGSGSSDKKAKR